MKIRIFWYGCVGGCDVQNDILKYIYNMEWQTQTKYSFPHIIIIFFVLRTPTDILNFLIKDSILFLFMCMSVCLYRVHMYVGAGRHQNWLSYSMKLASKAVVSHHGG